MSFGKTFKKLGKAVKKTAKFVHNKLDVHNYIPGFKDFKKKQDRVGANVLAGAASGYAMGFVPGAIAGGIAGGVKGVKDEVDRTKQESMERKAKRSDVKNRRVAQEGLNLQKEESRKAEQIQAEQAAKEKANSERLAKEESDAIRLLRRRQRKSLIANDDFEQKPGRRKTLG